MAIKPFMNNTAAAKHKRMLDRAVIMAMTAAIILPGMAFAEDAQSNLCGVLGTVNTLLNVASFAIVTIAIIFSGYQIAFAHKRITEVAPALIGGVLIGAAAQIAKMVIGSSNSGNTCGGTSNNGAMLLDHMHSAMQLLQHYA
jgi:type IV secretion system protein VirB2